MEKERIKKRHSKISRSLYKKKKDREKKKEGKEPEIEEHLGENF